MPAKALRGAGFKKRFRRPGSNCETRVNAPKIESGSEDLLAFVLILILRGWMIRVVKHCKHSSIVLGEIGSIVLIYSERRRF